MLSGEVGTAGTVVTGLSRGEKGHAFSPSLPPSVAFDMLLNGVIPGAVVCGGVGQRH